MKIQTYICPECNAVATDPVDVMDNWRVSTVAIGLVEHRHGGILVSAREIELETDNG